MGDLLLFKIQGNIDEYTTLCFVSDMQMIAQWTGFIHLEVMPECMNYWVIFDLSAIIEKLLMSQF